MASFTKYSLWRVLCCRWVSRFIRWTAPVIRRVLSPATRSRIPIVGEVNIRLMEGVEFSLFSDGADRFSNQLFWNGPRSYEWSTLQVICALARKSSCIFDVGSNIGLMALAAARANPQALVYAFEPVPKIFADLDRNARRNGLSNLTAVNCAVGDKVGSITMEMPANFLIHPITASAAVKFHGPSTQLEVQCVTIDSTVAHFQIPRIDLIKSDTEGMDHRVLAGASGTLSEYRPSIVLEVWPGDAGEKIESAIRDSNYRYFWITGSSLVSMEHITGDPLSIDTNYLLLPSERVTEFRTWLSRQSITMS